MLHFLFWLFVSIVIIQFIYYVLVFSNFSFAKIEKSTVKNIPISVIVCTKNDQFNVQKYIPLLANQNYPNFEIVLIDDASSDDTIEIFEQFEKQFANIKIVKVANNEAFWGNKKFALTLGIKAATHEHLLFTDADCYPTSTNWIAEMSSYFDNQKTVVLGFSGYHLNSNTLFSKLIRFESVLNAMQYFSWAKIGKPYTGNGKNLAYTKSEFFKTNGFINHMKIRSGSDSLFINEATNKNNTAICFSKNSFTISEIDINFMQWFKQMQKQLATSKHYKMPDKLQLKLFNLSQILVIALPIILLLYVINWQIVTGLIIFRYIFTWIILGYSAAKLNEKKVMYLFPIVEIMLIIVQLNVFVANLFSKQPKWK